MPKTKKYKRLPAGDDNLKSGKIIPWKGKHPQVVDKLIILREALKSKFPPGTYKGMRDHLIASLIYLSGCITYITGLFLPYYTGDNGPVKSIDALIFGGIYFLMVGFAGILCIIGILLKRNYYRILVSNVIFCFLEEIYNQIFVIAVHPLNRRIIGDLEAGYYLTYFGCVIGIIGCIYFWPFPESLPWTKKKAARKTWEEQKVYTIKSIGAGYIVVPLGGIVAEFGSIWLIILSRFLRRLKRMARFG